MINVGIIGATGYTGSELLRLLAPREDVCIKIVTSRKDAGTPVSAMFPNLRGFTDVAFSNPDSATLSACDVVFFATPHGVCMQEAPALIAAGVKVIDLSADFRLKDTAVFEQWYKLPHTAPELLQEAVYGLPEMGNREAIKQARIIGNPGCYPTFTQLALRPLIMQDLIADDGIIADVKSGTSGAGRGAKVANLFSEVDGSFKAYGASGHRHEPEIQQEISQLAHKPLHITFVPHLVPMVRGIEATIYARLKAPQSDVLKAFNDCYRDEYFIDVMGENVCPETRSVRGSNFVRIGIHRSTDGKTVIISAVGDNLMKGAAGQAVQCMNLMMNCAEAEGLRQVALMP